MTISKFEMFSYSLSGSEIYKYNILLEILLDQEIIFLSLFWPHFLKNVWFLFKETKNKMNS